MPPVYGSISGLASAGEGGLVESSTPKSLTRNEPRHWTLTDGAAVTGISGDVCATATVGVDDPEVGPGSGVVFAGSGAVEMVVAIIGDGVGVGSGPGVGVGQSHAAIAIRTESTAATEPTIAQRSALLMIPSPPCGSRGLTRVLIENLGA